MPVLGSKEEGQNWVGRCSVLYSMRRGRVVGTRTPGCVSFVSGECHLTTNSWVSRYGWLSSAAGGEASTKSDSPRVGGADLGTRALGAGVEELPKRVTARWPWGG